jgi:predicted amidohydrolase YtcJ
MRWPLLSALAAYMTAALQPAVPQPVHAPDRATLVIVNAKIWTGDPARPWAQAIAIRGDEILLVGSDAEVRNVAAGVTSVDAAGRLVTPGFIDSHIHLLTGGFQLASVQLRGVTTREELLRRIEAFTRTVPPGTWITHGRWDDTLWGGELPTREWIDRVTPNHPVWLTRIDGHMALANSTALKAAQVTRDTPDVPGGTIVRDSRGEPTGILKENAKALVDRVVPTPSPEMHDRALDAAMRYVAQRGVTSVHNMGTWLELETFERARKAGVLRTRVYAAVPLADWERLAATVRSRRFGGEDGRGDAWLRVGALKGYVDGSLGSRTAAFHEPFADAPTDRGRLVNTPDDLYAWVSSADRAGLHVLVHAIGDRAIGLLLDVYDRVSRENGSRDRRFRVEHAQHIAPRDVPRFGKLGVIASVQPYHAIDDGRWAEAVIGPERSKTTYAFRSLLDTGAIVAMGSDWFVAPPSPLEGIYAAVTRRTLDDKHPAGWVPHQKITVEEALKAYTVNAAYAGFEESRKGQLTAGRAADLVMLERDIFEIPPEQIRDVAVVMTIVGGKVVYRTGGNATANAGAGNMP